MRVSPMSPAVILYALGVLALLSGCSAFKGSRRLDMAPFSENSRVLFSEAAKVSRRFQYKHLRPYLDPSEAERVREKAEPLLLGFRGIVYYSNQVVAISNSNLSTKEKNSFLARYLEEAFSRAADKIPLDSLGIDESSVRTALDDIRGAETYLGAIAAADPIVNAVVTVMQERLDELQYTVFPQIVAMFEIAIEEDYADRKANYEQMKDLQARSMRALSAVYEARMGDRGAWQDVLAADPSVKDLVPAVDKATSKQLDAAEAYLTGRLTEIDTVLHQLDLDLAVYRAIYDELGEWWITTDEKIKIARNAIMVWAQSHRNLGDGVAVPPLIDVKGVTGGLVGSAKDAVF